MPFQIVPLATLSPPSTARTWLSSPHPTLPLLATACADHSAKIYSLRNFELQSAATGGHKRSVRAVAWKPSSSIPVPSVAGDDNGSDVRSAGTSRTELTLATGSFDASAAIWKSGGLSSARPIDFSSGLVGMDTDAHEDHDDDDEWRLEVILDGHDSEIKSLSFCPVAPLLATCGRDKSVWIWEELEDEDGGGGEGNFETVAVLQEHEGDVKCVAWHPLGQLLASGSYDDRIRIWREDVDDWACCARLDGHRGTVWWVEFEGAEVRGPLSAGNDEAKAAWRAQREKSGPRLISCSDDMSIRVWRRIPKELPPPPTGQGRIPSIWKNTNFEEEWVEETQLPRVHDRPIYAVNWSRKTGRVVSAGSDGLIIVYEERWRGQGSGDVEMKDTAARPNGQETNPTTTTTEWMIIAQTENAHDVFEINHVVWAPRADKGRQWEDEEVIVTTGDDGEVKVWTLQE